VGKKAAAAAAQTCTSNRRGGLSLGLCTILAIPTPIYYMLNGNTGGSGGELHIAQYRLQNTRGGGQ